MKKIIDYLMVSAYVISDVSIDKTVYDYIQSGWQPYGSPFCVPESDGEFATLFQAMVMYEG